MFSLWLTGRCWRCSRSAVGVPEKYDHDGGVCGRRGEDLLLPGPGEYGTAQGKEENEGEDDGKLGETLELHLVEDGNGDQQEEGGDNGDEHVDNYVQTILRDEIQKGLVAGASCLGGRSEQDRGNGSRQGFEASFDHRVRQSSLLIARQGYEVLPVPDPFQFRSRLGAGIVDRVEQTVLISNRRCLQSTHLVHPQKQLIWGLL